MNNGRYGRKEETNMRKIVMILILAAIICNLLPANADADYSFESMKAGTYVTFGTYEQDNSPDNGQEPIEWRVLAVEGDQCLLISRYALARDFYSCGEKYVTWENSDIRAWLNSDFISEAFTQTEQSYLVDTPVMNSDSIDGGNDTIDKVFLLSADEAMIYFSSDSDRRCAQSPYAIKQEVLPYFGSDYNTLNGEYSVWWWLRTTVDSGRCAVGVKPDGDLFMGGGYCDTNQAIRPALWIKTNGIETGSGISDADSGELTIDDFLGSYMDMDPDNIIPGLSNPLLLDLYYDENGQLTGCSKMSYGTTGTTFYYPYISYTINGNQIDLYYEEITNPYYGSEYSPDVHTFFYSEGNLLEILPGGFEHMMYRVE